MDLALEMEFTTPKTAGEAGDTLDGYYLYTVECPDNKCPPQVKNPSHTVIKSNQLKYEGKVPRGKPTELNSKVDVTFPLIAEKFPPGSYFTFAIILINSKGVYSDAVYLTSPIKVPDAPPPPPGPVSELDAKYL